MKAIVFAAGLGTRLKPFTLSHPKALVTINGKTVLERAITRLISANIVDIIVNVHHFPEQIITFLKENNNFGANITISNESDKLLDTGGALVKIAPLLSREDHIIACNADILTDFPISQMLDAHICSGADVTLLAQERKSSRYLYFDSVTNTLEGWINKKTNESKPMGFEPDNNMIERAFGGYHILSSKALELISKQPADTAFGIVPWYLSNLNHIKICAYTPSSPYQWFDIGSPETLETARSNFKETI